MHYLVTGHTGFKGSWLALLLAARGHTVSGIALDPPAGGLFEAGEVASAMATDLRLDIRDAEATTAAIRSISPDVVIHLAAQPLVRDSYRDPRTTFETNVMGTLNVLEGISSAAGIQAAVIVTTDKVYRNVNRADGYREDEPLGGHDPYSSSKAMADILTQSWVASFPGVPTAVARAGNVIGGGDVSTDRLLPDLIASFAAGRVATIRFPDAVRPWQHVLDCLDGYLTLVDALLDGRGTGEWNLGPGPESFVPVSAIADLVAEQWGDGAAWHRDGGTHPHEAGLLALDASKAQRELGWHNRLPFPASLEWTVDWQQRVTGGASPRTVTLDQITAFERLA
jgi:CDP-glucose 4,6-dehydratase